MLTTLKLVETIENNISFKYVVQHLKPKSLNVIGLSDNNTNDYPQQYFPVTHDSN